MDLRHPKPLSFENLTQIYESVLSNNIDYSAGIRKPVIET